MTRKFGEGRGKGDSEKGSDARLGGERERRGVGEGMILVMGECGGEEEVG